MDTCSRRNSSNSSWRLPFANFLLTFHAMRRANLSSLRVTQGLNLIRGQRASRIEGLVTRVCSHARLSLELGLNVVIFLEAHIYKHMVYCCFIKSVQTRPGNVSKLQSTIPPFRHSSVSPFHHSTVLLFYRSTILAFRVAHLRWLMFPPSRDQWHGDTRGSSLRCARTFSKSLDSMSSDLLLPFLIFGSKIWRSICRQ